jgi:hypothetical protein
VRGRITESQPSNQDRRIRILKPIEKLRAHDRDWTAAHFAPLTILYPQHDYGPVMRRHPEFHAALRRTCVPFLPLGAKTLLSVPDMILFLNRAGGYMVIAALLQAAMTAGDHPFAVVPYADVGDRFGVSRTHDAHKLLAAAEKAGLVKLHARGGRRVEILPRLWSSHDRRIAGGMYMHDMARHDLYGDRTSLRSGAMSREHTQRLSVPRADGDPGIASGQIPNPSLALNSSNGDRISPFESMQRVLKASKNPSH